jgi:4-carboxymuconolactone decarboxylase
MRFPFFPDTEHAMNSTAGPERLGPIAPEKMTDAQKKVAADIAAGPRGPMRGGPFSVMLRSPDLLGPAQQVGEYLRFKCPIDRRIIELVTCMTARYLTQQFEWFAHSKQALEAGLKAETVEAIAECRRPQAMPQDEETAYDFVSELLATKGVSDQTYERARAKFGEKGVVDIVGMVGYYQLIGLQMNVARTPIPDGKPLPLPCFPL